MLCFEVSLNGEQLCTTGAEDLRVMSTRLTWGRRQDEGKDVEFLRLESGGMNQAMEHVRWSGREDLAIGDEITLRIVESEEADPPDAGPAVTGELQDAISQLIAKFRSERSDGDV